MKKTRCERVSDTVHFKHAYITQPAVTPTDILVKTLQELTQTIKDAPNLKGAAQLEALKKLETLLHQPAGHDDTRRPRVVNLGENEDAKVGEIERRRTQRPSIQPRWMGDYVNNIFDADTGKILKYRQLLTNPRYKTVWSTSSANEFGRLAQGIGGRVKGTNTIFFVTKQQVPKDRIKDVTYVKFVCELKPNKEEVHRTRMAVGGDKVNYPDNVGTPTTELLLVKTHTNSVISTPNARYMTLEIWKLLS